MPLKSPGHVVSTAANTSTYFSFLPMYGYKLYRITHPFCRMSYDRSIPFQSESLTECDLPLPLLYGLPLYYMLRQFSICTYLILMEAVCRNMQDP